MADPTLVRMNTGTIEALTKTDNNGKPEVDLVKGSIYFAVDMRENALGNPYGKIVYDVDDNNRIVMSTRAEVTDAVLADVDDNNQLFFGGFKSDIDNDLITTNKQYGLPLYSTKASIMDGVLYIDNGLEVGFSNYVYHGDSTASLLTLNANGLDVYEGFLTADFTANQELLTISENTLISANTTSTDAISGALVVTGGVGIGENLNIGENLTVGGDSTLADIFPADNNTYNIGSSTNKWYQIYAEEFWGNLIGNADTATKWAAPQTAYVNLALASTTTTLQGDDVNPEVLGVDGVLPISNGGTGTNTAPIAGGIIYGSSTTAFGSTAAGIAGQYLKSRASQTPVWETFVTPEINFDVDLNQNTTITVETDGGTSVAVTLPQNTDSNSGVVSAGGSYPNCAWRTDENGDPGWIPDTTAAPIFEDITLYKDDWVGNQYVVTSDNVTPNSVQIVSFPSYTYASIKEMEAIEAAQLVDGGQTSGRFTLIALGEIPSINIDIRVCYYFSTDSNLISVQSAAASANQAAASAAQASAFAKMQVKKIILSPSDLGKNSANPTYPYAYILPWIGVSKDDWVDGSGVSNMDWAVESNTDKVILRFAKLLDTSTSINVYWAACEVA